MNSAKISARFQEETMNQSISSQIIDHKMRNQAENRNPKSRFVEYLSVLRDREWTPLSLSLFDSSRASVAKGFQRKVDSGSLVGSQMLAYRITNPDPKSDTIKNCNRGSDPRASQSHPPLTASIFFFFFKYLQVKN